MMELLSDNGVLTDPLKVCGGTSYAESKRELMVVRDEDQGRVRPYTMTVVVFGPGDAAGYERVWARSRPEAFCKVVVNEWNPDNVRVVRLEAIGRTNRNRGDFSWVDESRRYGGVTCDLTGDGMSQDVKVITSTGDEVAINPGLPSGNEMLPG